MIPWILKRPWEGPPRGPNSAASAELERITGIDGHTTVEDDTGLFLQTSGRGGKAPLITEDLADARRDDHTKPEGHTRPEGQACFGGDARRPEGEANREDDTLSGFDYNTLSGGHTKPEDHTRPKGHDGLAGSVPRPPRRLVLAAIALAVMGIASPGAWAATAQEVFVILPPDQVRGLSPVIRRDLLSKAHQGASGYSAPSPEGFWVETHGDNALTMYGTGAGPVVLKVFQTDKGWTLAVICRSRQTQGPSSLVEPPHDSYLDLSHYLVSPAGDLIRAEYADYFPTISVLDFMTADTVEDKGAVRDLAWINQSFSDCLTCHASAQDPLALDILTVTSVNGHSCAHLMAQFKLLPLKWNGEHFIKPYDRAAPFVEEDRPLKKPRGLYYHDAGQ